MAKKQQKLSGDFEPDHARYRKASEPHESPKAAEEAGDAFARELSELRVKYRIRDFYSVYNIALMEDDGKESVVSATSAFGTQSLWLSMAAFAYGYEKAKHEKHIRRLLAADNEGE